MILECKKIKVQEKIKLKERIVEDVTLAIITIGKFSESEIYLKNKRKLAAELGIEILKLEYDNNHSKEEIIAEIKRLNEDSNITGIMIQKPILSKFFFQELVNYIDYRKDVEGLTTRNKDLLARGLSSIIPCTARAVLKVFEEYKIPLLNRKIAIIGKSDLVGMPLYHILKRDNLVTLCDSKTEDLKTITLGSDIVITSIGKANYFTKEYFRNGQVVIDVGTNYANGKLVGDVHFEEIRDLDIMITPVPGGIGQLTPIYLYSNLLELENKR